MERVMGVRNGICIVDGFLDDWEQVARAARGEGFEEVTHGEETYAGVQMKLGYDPWPALAEAVGFDPAPAPWGGSFYRLGSKEHDVNHFIHCDMSMSAAWAGVLYLSEAPADETFGTAFWSHREFGTGAAEEISAELAEAVNAAGNSDRGWRLEALVHQKPNRLVTYPSHLFHSRWPRSIKQEPEDGRLVQTFFFDRKEDRSWALQQRPR